MLLKLRRALLELFFYLFFRFNTKSRKIASPSVERVGQCNETERPETRTEKQYYIPYKNALRFDILSTECVPKGFCSGSLREHSLPYLAHMPDAGRHTRRIRKQRTRSGSAGFFCGAAKQAFACTGNSKEKKKNKMEGTKTCLYPARVHVRRILFIPELSSLHAQTGCSISAHCS